MLFQRPQIFIPTVHHALTPSPTPSLCFLLTSLCMLLRTREWTPEAIQIGQFQLWKFTLRYIGNELFPPAESLCTLSFGAKYEVQWVETGLSQEPISIFVINKRILVMVKFASNFLWKTWFPSKRRGKKGKTRIFILYPSIACEQALLFGRVKRVSRERASEQRGVLARLASLAVTKVVDG